ncbi:MAG: hypothetical protein ACKOHM_03900, partial [Spartobacteria bacterium]
SGLVGLCLATPVWGVWVVIPFGLAMPMMSFFVSTYLNQWTGSALRATVLSFRGMALNIGYALAGIGFASVVSNIRATTPLATENAIFGKALLALPTAFALGWIALTLIAWRSRGKISDAP